MTSVAVLNKDSHGDLRVKNQPNFAMAKDQNILPIVVHEFISASVDFPVLFLKAPDGSSYQSVILTGVKSNENLFYDGENWSGLYVPNIFWNPPFQLVADEQDKENIMLAIDEDSHLVSREEGEPLYDENGAKTNFHLAREKAIMENQTSAELTLNFAAFLEHLGLLTQQALTIEVKGEKINLQGLHFVDEGKLNELPEEQFLDLRNRGFLPVIYAQMTSMKNLYRLMKLANESE